MELCDKTLKDIIYTINRTFSEINRMRYVISCELWRQILEDVKYLHKKNIIHRDLNPINIFIKNSESEKVLKLGDMGLSVKHNFADESHSIDKGTPRYMAPETFYGKYDTKSDIFSLGIICEELFNIDITKLSFKFFE
jgi:serine/threonine protein kinase